MTTITLINALAVKPGRIDEFIALQRDFANAMSGRQVGPLGGRMYRNQDGSKALLISQFKSRDTQAATTRSAEFQAHLAGLREMVDSSSPEFFEEAYTYGAFE
jgi:heme-degrading monooxygenase HmoA